MTTNTQITSAINGGKKRIAALILCGIFMPAIVMGCSPDTKIDSDTTVVQVDSATNPKGWDVDKSKKKDWKNELVDQEELKANEEEQFAGMAFVNEESINRSIYFNLQEGQSFHITYQEDDDGLRVDQGSFIVGVISSDGKKFLADTLLKQDGDTLTFEVPETGKYYFYVKGLEKNSNHFPNSVSYLFNVYFE